MSEAVDLLLRKALEAAVYQTGETRLISKGAKAPGLFHEGTLKQRGEAVENCFSLGLLEKTREIQEGKGKTARTAVFVKITPAGMKLLFENVPITRGQEILAQVSPAYRPSAHAAFQEVASGRLQAMREELTKLIAAEQEAYMTTIHLVTERRTFLAGVRKSLECAVEDAGASIEEPLPRHDKDRSRGPVTEEDLDFQRDQAEQMVFAWQDVDAAGKEALENVLQNLGLQALGERGQIVHFDGREHQTEDEVETGEPVVVREPGWRLSNSRGVYLVAKTRVAKKGAE